MSKLPSLLPSFLPSVGADPDDSVVVEYQKGFAQATVRKSDGRVLTQRVYSRGGFQAFTAFDPNSMSRDEMKQLVREMRATERTTQAEIARKLGISQSTVSNYLRSKD